MRKTEPSVESTRHTGASRPDEWQSGTYAIGGGRSSSRSSRSRSLASDGVGRIPALPLLPGVYNASDTIASARTKSRWARR